MTTHLGIELSPGACRIVEIDAGSPWPSRRGATRVRSFAVLPPSGAETDARLASLRGKPAAVIVWSAPSEHRQVVVTGASYETMRAEALASLAASGLQTRGVLADISPAGDRPKRGMRQPVVVTFASCWTPCLIFFVLARCTRIWCFAVATCSATCLSCAAIAPR